MLIKPLKCCTELKSWAMRIVKRAGMSKANGAGRGCRVWQAKAHAPRVPRAPTCEAPLPAISAGGGTACRPTRSAEG